MLAIIFSYIDMQLHSGFFFLISLYGLIPILLVYLISKRKQGGNLLKMMILILLITPSFGYIYNMISINDILRISSMIPNNINKDVANERYGNLLYEQNTLKGKGQLFHFVNMKCGLSIHYHQFTLFDTGENAYFCLRDKNFHSAKTRDFVRELNIMEQSE